jgi:hypothetical protein
MAAFLSAWLIGWVVGEVFAIGISATIGGSMTGVLSKELFAWSADLAKSGGAAFLILFLLLWLTFWTIGGVVALTQAVRSLAGEDVIGLRESGFDVVRRAGPFQRRYRFDRSAIRRLRVRPHDRAVVADTVNGISVVTSFGAPADREAVADWLSRHLGLADADAAMAKPPATWEVRTEGEVAYVRKVRPGARLTRSVISWLLTAAIASAWYASVGHDGPIGSIPAMMLTVLLALGAAMSTWGRREWIVRPGELTFRRSFALWTAERTFRSARLEVVHEADSDNDHHYTLVVIDGAGRKPLHSQVHDSGEVVDLANWLAARTGFPLTSALARR